MNETDEELKDHAWVCGKLDYLSNALSDVRDGLLDAVHLPADRSHLTSYGRRIAKVQDQLASLSELSEEIYNAVLKLGNGERLMNLQSDTVEVMIRHDNQVIWVNTGEGCVCRISGIKELILNDKREKEE